MRTLICVQMIFLLISPSNGKTIECPYQGTCSNKQLWCTDNEDCIVNCQQCNGATIYCPRTPHHCNVTCSTANGQRSCENTVISYTITHVRNKYNLYKQIYTHPEARKNANGTKLTVIASGHNDIFQNGVVKCPLHSFYVQLA
eukprot:450653_1